MNIYIVEDDANIRELESYALSTAGFETREFDGGTAFFAACAETLPDLVVLDIMLPGESGFDILKRMRLSPVQKDVPVVMVTACSAEIDAVRGLDGGCDDYIVKPFGVMEFISRVKAVLRRTHALRQEPTLSVGCITLDDERHAVAVSGAPTELTFKEFELLKCLMQNPGTVMTRDLLMDRVWGTDFTGESRTVDMHVKTLRQKLGEAGALIRTVRNVGYKIEA